MNWLLVYEIFYVTLLILACMRIVYDTRSNTKTLAYLLLVIFLPLLGIFIYFSFGINYHKRKIYSKKLVQDDVLEKSVREKLWQHSRQIFAKGSPALRDNKELAYMLVKDSGSAITTHNEVKILVNGEEKFPAVLQAMATAKDHIHIEYYIYEDDEIGNAIADMLERKAAEGVEVRFIYDDFGSRSIRRRLVKRLQKAGVKAFPFYRIIFIALANRLNYRNHRKIIVIDGCVAFVGGINVSDRYINCGKKNKVFWRDTHLQLEGPGVQYLQYLFLCDWNFCASEHLQPTPRFFPPDESLPVKGNKTVQVAASGPDSDTPTMLFALLQAIYLAREELLITTPYFIPGESIIDALVVSAMGGVKVRLLVPGISDSLIVNAAARSYYSDLLDAGVEVYQYQKGFVHAKTLVADRKLAIVGTANMDNRSFELNFEVAALVYDEATARELATVFEKDISDALRIDPYAWQNRPWYKQLMDKTARLVSPLL